MELCKETLADYLSRRQKKLNALLDEEYFINEELKKYLKLYLSVVKSVEYIHSLGLIHRDIKPSNVFLKGDSIKLGDFGLATQNIDGKYIKHPRKLSVFSDDSFELSTDLSYHTKNVGTPLYASNEQINDNYYDQKVL